MTRKQGSKVAGSRFRVVKGIESDMLKRRHEPGEIADLSEWPAEVIKAWLEQGVITSTKVGKNGPER